MYQEEFAEILSYHFMVFTMMKIRKNIKKNKKLEFLIDIFKKKELKRNIRKPYSRNALGIFNTLYLHIFVTLCASVRHFSFLVIIFL